MKAVTGGCLSMIYKTHSPSSAALIIAPLVIAHARSTFDRSLLGQVKRSCASPVVSNIGRNNNVTVMGKLSATNKSIITDIVS